MSTPKKNPRAKNTPANAVRRGKRLFDKLLQGSVISFNDAEKTQRTKLGYLLEKGLAAHSPEGIKLTSLARWQWYARNGATHAWAQLTPGRQEKLAVEFEKIFLDNKKQLLQNVSARVETPSQYFRHRAGEYRKYAEELSHAMKRMRGSDYDGAFSEYQRMVRLVTIYQGVARMIGDKRRSQSIGRQPPHSL